MHLNILLHSLLEMSHHYLAVSCELENEIRLQHREIYVVIFRLFIVVFELDFNRLLDRRRSSLKLLLLLVLLAEQVVSLEHEDHLLLGFLQETS